MRCCFHWGKPQILHARTLTTFHFPAEPPLLLYFPPLPSLCFFSTPPLVLIRTQCREVRSDFFSVLPAKLWGASARRGWTCAAVSVRHRLTVGFPLSLSLCLSYSLCFLAVSFCFSRWCGTFYLYLGVLFRATQGWCHASEVLYHSGGGQMTSFSHIPLIVLLIPNAFSLVEITLFWGD